MTRISQRFGLTLAAALALAVAASPAQARTVKLDAGAGEGSASTHAVSDKQRSARGPKYCLVDSLTGSRLPAKVCKTEQEWKADGVDIRNLK